ncbi:MAG: lipase family protein [Gammaproteobacteria bacterium]|nr:lipase family protein [Gammaproteobacteria bacterium]
MRILKPFQAAFAAESVYAVRTEAMALEYFNLNANPGKEFFDVHPQTVMKGASGGYVMNTESGFGLKARGRGLYEKDAIVVFRGTKTKLDWVSNLYTSPYNLTMGKSVHSGFQRIFLTLHPQLEVFFAGNHFEQVHCIGHSLGGALATLTAEWVHRKGISKPVLYTFGCPRVGDFQFAQSLTNAMGVENIFRVYQKSDPVPMIPLWPYVHVPQPGTECYLGTDSIVRVSDHDMNLYAKQVAGKEWTDLRKSPPRPNWDAMSIEQWLKSASALTLSQSSLMMINAALMHVLKRVATAAGLSLNFLVIGGTTMLDLMAIALVKGARETEEMEGIVKHLVRRMLQVIGFVVDLTHLTYNVIRWALDQLRQAIHGLAKAAVLRLPGT